MANKNPKNTFLPLCPEIDQVVEEFMGKLQTVWSLKALEELQLKMNNVISNREIQLLGLLEDEYRDKNRALEIQKKYILRQKREERKSA